MAVENHEGKDEELLLIETVGELRRLYDYVVASFDAVRNKALALLVGEVAIVTFLFSRNPGEGLIKNGAPLYGYVALALGIALLVFAAFRYFTVIATIQWVFPTEDYDMKNPTEKFKHSRLLFLRYLHAEYMSKAPKCIAKVKQRSDWFMHATIALAIGILLIILVRYGGGA